MKTNLLPCRGCGRARLRLGMMKAGTRTRTILRIGALGQTRCSVWDLAIGRRGAEGDRCTSDIGGTKSIFKLSVILRRVILDVLARSAWNPAPSPFPQPEISSCRIMDGASDTLRLFGGHAMSPHTLGARSAVNRASVPLPKVSHLRRIMSRTSFSIDQQAIRPRIPKY
jgi:hypothetical protein